MENLLPHVVKKIGQEIRQLMQNSIEGVLLLTNEREITDIQAIIDGPTDTPYENGKFRIRIALSNSYPQQPPKGFFVTKIFHPNISPKNGEICVNILKKDWSADFGIRKILLTVKCLLIYPNAESALNEEAGHLLLEDYTEYAKRARLFTDIYATHTSTTNSGTSCSNVAHFSAEQPQSLSGPGSSAPPDAILKINTDSNDAGPVAKKINNASDHNGNGGASISESSAANQKRAVPQHKKALRRL